MGAGDDRQNVVRIYEIQTCWTIWSIGFMNLSTEHAKDWTFYFGPWTFFCCDKDTYFE